MTHLFRFWVAYFNCVYILSSSHSASWKYGGDMYSHVGASVCVPTITPISSFPLVVILPDSSLTTLSTVNSDLKGLLFEVKVPISSHWTGLSHPLISHCDQCLYLPNFPRINGLFLVVLRCPGPVRPWLVSPCSYFFQFLGIGSALSLIVKNTYVCFTCMFVCVPCMPSALRS